MIYRSVVRDTLWKFVKETTKPCGKVVIKLRSLEGDVLMVFGKETFLKWFEPFKNG